MITDLRRRSLLLAGSALALPLHSRAQAGAAWSRIEAAARGQTFYFNAWGGSERTNAYLQWAAGELAQRHGVKLEHVKLSDTSELVKRVRAEKAAGRSNDGSADLVWINGENFLAMKREGLLFGPWSETLPSYAQVDSIESSPARLTEHLKKEDFLFVERYPYATFTSTEVKPGGDGGTHTVTVWSVASGQYCWSQCHGVCPPCGSLNSAWSW